MRSFSHSLTHSHFTYLFHSTLIFSFLYIFWQTSPPPPSPRSILKKGPRFQESPTQQTETGQQQQQQQLHEQQLQEQQQHQVSVSTQ